MGPPQSKVCLPCQPCLISRYPLFCTGDRKFCLQILQQASYCQNVLGIRVAAAPSDDPACSSKQIETIRKAKPQQQVGVSLIPDKRKGKKPSSHDGGPSRGGGGVLPKKRKVTSAQDQTQKSDDTEPRTLFNCVASSSQYIRALRDRMNPAQNSKQPSRLRGKLAHGSVGDHRSVPRCGDKQTKQASISYSLHMVPWRE
jgi:hypothetical protein